MDVAHDAQKDCKLNMECNISILQQNICFGLSCVITLNIEI